MFGFKLSDHKNNSTPYTKYEFATTNKGVVPKGEMSQEDLEATKKKAFAEELTKDMKQIEKNKKYIVWIQEFSKKIVTVTFILYVLSMLFTLWLAYSTFETGVVSSLDTMISEINQTFRDVIGGYIIKSAVENSFKIGGNYFIGLANAKLEMARLDMIHMHGVDPATISQGINTAESEEDPMGPVQG